MVSQSYLLVIDAFRSLGRAIDLSTLTTRMVFQKIVYFLQEFGLQTDYSFGWYIHGPYSSELTRDAFGALGVETTIPTPRQVTPRSPEIEKTQALLGDLGSDELSTVARRLELLSSFHFIAKRARPRAETMDEAFAALERDKPHMFSAEEKIRAWESLQRRGLFATE